MKIYRCPGFKIFYLSIIIIVFITPNLLLPYEASMPNIKVPSNLNKNQMEIIIQHRFYGELTNEPLDTLFGMTQGANVGLGIRDVVFPGFEINASYILGQQEYYIGANYTLLIPKIILKTQLNIGYFNFKKSPENREGSIFALVSLQSEPLLNRLIPAVNIGYDGYFQGIGFGAGLRIDILEKLSLMGEFFPLITGGKAHPEELGETGSFTIGLMLTTSGHQFTISTGNSYEIGPRRMMTGAFGSNLYLGFNIQRLFTF